MIFQILFNKQLPDSPQMCLLNSSTKHFLAVLWLVPIPWPFGPQGTNLIRGFESGYWHFDFFNCIENMKIEAGNCPMFKDSIQNFNLN